MLLDQENPAEIPRCCPIATRRNLNRLLDLECCLVKICPHLGGKTEVDPTAQPVRLTRWLGAVPLVIARQPRTAAREARDLPAAATRRQAGLTQSSLGRFGEADLGHLAAC